MTPVKVAANISLEALTTLSNGQTYFTASYANEFPMLCHTTPAGKLVDYMAKPLRKKATYDYYEWR